MPDLSIPAILPLLHKRTSPRCHSLSVDLQPVHIEAGGDEPLLFIPAVPEYFIFAFLNKGIEQPPHKLPLQVIDIYHSLSFYRHEETDRRTDTLTSSHTFHTYHRVGVVMQLIIVDGKIGYNLILVLHSDIGIPFVSTHIDGVAIDSRITCQVVFRELEVGYIQSPGIPCR